MNIAALGFLDGSAMAAVYTNRHRLKAPDDLILRRFSAEIADEIEDTKLLTEWKSARAMLTRIKNMAAPFLGGEPPALGLAFIDVLKPGTHTDWAADDSEYAKAHCRLRLCLIPSPGGWTYSGGEAAIIQVGVLTFVNAAALCSEVNVGPCSRVHLVVDVKRPDAP